MRDKIGIIVILCIAQLYVVTGCTSNIKPSPDIKIPSLTERSINKMIGLYMSPDYCNYTSKLDDLEFLWGNDLCRGTKSVVKLAFEYVITLSSPKPDDVSVKVVIVPEIHASFVSRAPKGEALLIGVWRAFDPDGKLIWIDTFKGNIRTEGGAGSEILEKRMQFALEEYFQNALDGMTKWQLWRP